jgi:hypothetical protein
MARRFATTFATALLLAGLCGAAPAAAETASFVIDSPPHEETFVIRLKDPAKIEHARRILRGEETMAVHVMGKIRRRAAPWNEPWRFVLVPRTIEFFELAIEVCDASIAYVEEHLHEAGSDFLPGRIWCPWGSRVIAEITP